MTTLVTGGSKCGKSHFAEKILDCRNEKKIYIATMQPFGKDAFEAIERHRVMREGKNFITIEKYTDISNYRLIPTAQYCLNVWETYAQMKCFAAM